MNQPEINVAAELEKKFQDKLKYRDYPSDLPDHWYLAATNMLRNQSLLTLGVSASEYQGVLDAIQAKKPTMMQFAITSNALEASTPGQLTEGNLQTYATLMVEVKHFAAIWTEESTKLRGEAKREVEMLMTAAGDRAPMTAIKGEA